MIIAPFARLGGVALALFAIATVGVVCAKEDTDAATRQFASAAALQNRGVYDLAAEEWAKLIDNHSDDSRVDQAFHNLGICYLKSNDLDLARQSFELAIKSFPNSNMLEGNYLYLGVAQYSMAEAGRKELYAEAAKTFEKLIAKFSKGKFTPRATFYCGECFYAGGDKTKASKTYSQLIKQFPKSELVVDALYALGVTQEELGQFDAAGKSFDRFLKQFPKSPLATEVGMRRGETLFAKKEYAKAAKRFADAAANKGFELADHATVREAAATAQLKQYGKAAEIYASVAARFPKSQYVGLANLAGGKCYYLTAKFDRARALLTKVKGQSAPKAAHWIARCWLKQGKPKEALDTAENAIKTGPKGDVLVQLLMDRADATYENPKLRARAVALYAELAKKYPKDPEAPQALYMAGFAALGQREYKTSLGYANEFLKTYPNGELTVDVTYVAAESCLQLGRLPDAEKFFGELLKKYPNYSDAESWKVRRGLTLNLQKKYQATIDTLLPVVEDIRAKEALAEAYYLIGISQVELKQYAAAVKSLDASVAAAAGWRQADDTLMALADACKRSGDLKRAKDTIRKLIAQFPKSRSLDRAHFRLAEYGYAEGDMKTAAEEYQKVIDGWPKSTLVPNAVYGLGWAELSRKDHAKANAAFSTLITKYPKSGLIARARYARGMALEQLKRHEQAIVDLKLVAASEANVAEKADARYVIGLCQVGMKRYADAVQTFQKLLATDPKYAAADKVLYELAWAQKSIKKGADAVATFRKLVSEYPDSPLVGECDYHIGEFEYDSGKFEAAAIVYGRAAKKATGKPLMEKVLHKLGWAQFRLGRFEDAKKTFAKQRASAPNGELATDAVFMEAECLFKLKKYKEALTLYGQVKNPSGKDFGVLTLLHGAQSAAQLKQWEKSLEMASRCVKEFPKSSYLPETLYEQGWAEQNLGRTDDAMKLYESVLEKTNREVAARAQFMIAELLFQKREHAEAVKAFFKVIYGYGYPKWQADATYEAARCFEVLGKKSKAAELYRELIKKYPKSDKVPLAKKRL